MAVGSRGLAGVVKRSEEIQSQRTGFGLRKFTQEFRWDGSKPPAENALSLRILGDDIIISTQMHRFVPLPENKFFNGVCRKAFPITPENSNPEFCYVCDVVLKEFDGDTKAKKRNGLVPTDVAIALAVEQEAVMNGRVFAGYKTKMIDFEIPQITDAEKNNEATAEAKAYRELLNKLGQPGSKVSIPSIGLMIGTLSGKQALFDYATRRQTISDRVFEISRHGKGLDTAWDWNHEGPDRDNPDPSGLLKEYQDKYPFELPEEWAIRNGSEERYNYFFKLGEAAGEGEPAVSAEAAADEIEPVSDSRSQLMERLKGK
ncbi:MAG TPA: hypothetical protein VIY48_15160 [Candidatus Paceibacterota bacterium]